MNGFRDFCCIEGSPLVGFHLAERHDEVNSSVIRGQSLSTVFTIV